jgi:hypothetical protein
MITKPGFPYNLLSLYCGDIGLKEKAKKHRSSIALGIMPQSSFTAFPLPLQTILLGDLLG